jgi:hypothetical protein
MMQKLPVLKCSSSLLLRKNFQTSSFFHFVAEFHTLSNKALTFVTCYDKKRLTDFSNPSSSLCLGGIHRKIAIVSSDRTSKLMAERTVVE